MCWTKDEMKAINKLVPIVKILAVEKHREIEPLKQKYSCLNRPNFIWHYLLQSFATWGRAAGWDELNKENNYQRITYKKLNKLSHEKCMNQIQDVFRGSNIRWPNRKAEYASYCVTLLKKLGGLEVAKAKLLAESGREAKINFLRTFPGIGSKYARNIMMDVYHEDFRDSIAIDTRIKNISKILGLSFPSYEEHEEFYLQVAHDAGINGWELDRLLFKFYKDVKSLLEQINKK